MTTAQLPRTRLSRMEGMATTGVIQFHDNGPPRRLQQILEAPFKRAAVRSSETFGMCYEYHDGSHKSFFMSNLCYSKRRDLRTIVQQSRFEDYVVHNVTSCVRHQPLPLQTTICIVNAAATSFCAQTEHTDHTARVFHGQPIYRQTDCDNTSRSSPYQTHYQVSSLLSS
jgi:hypothetical protein